ncbi:MAG TPA: hypothetical protein VF601_24245 [Beijerinckiaceae bacterium]|jgi:hypothetical protein
MEPFYSLSAAERVALTREAHDKGQPLMARWAEVQSDFGDRWLPRAQASAEWLAGASSVADLGCGTMNLEGCLRPGQSYIPVDVVARDNRTLVLDLNKPSDLARLPEAEACALLGVLEYSYAPDELLAALRRRYGQVVTTFNVLLDETRESRLEQGWVNHFTHSEFLELFSRHGFRLFRERFFGGRQYIFDFR